MKFTKIQLIVVTVVGILVAGAITAFIWQQVIDSDDQDTNGQAATEQPTSGLDDEELAELARAAELMNEASYVATISGEAADNIIDATMEFDGQGNVRFTAQEDGRTLQFILTPEFLYSCDGDTCYEFPADGQESQLLNPGDFTYTETDAVQYQSLGRNIGQESCPAGTCNVWEIEENDETNRIYIDVDSNLISQISGSSPDGGYTITMEYRDVSISAPDNAEPLPDGFQLN